VIECGFIDCSQSSVAKDSADCMSHVQNFERKYRTFENILQSSNTRHKKSFSEQKER
jgi:hypothetical protein